MQGLPAVGHAHPASTVQVLEQPSPEELLPSSQPSVGVRIPLPQISCTQAEGLSPEQNQVASTLQSAEQPSPPVVLPSSHCSELEFTVPSPQTGNLTQLFACGHLQPVSTVHVGLQPSPAARFPSSQPSPFSHTPLPHFVVAMTKLLQSAAQLFLSGGSHTSLPSTLPSPQLMVLLHTLGSPVQLVSGSI
jgi:hypothetical protein